MKFALFFQMCNYFSPLVSMLHMASQTLCKRTVPSFSGHSIDVPPANPVSEKCSESVGHKEGREGEQKKI